MAVLVTGASGFAGRHLLEELARSGSGPVTAAALHLPDEASGPGGEVRWLPLDMGSPESVRSVVAEVRPTRVYHLAGQASVGYSFSAPLETWDTNATGTLRLLHALEAEGVERPRVLLVSSAEVYGWVDRGDQPIRESQPVRPMTPYGASKAAAETVALQAARMGTAEVVVARSFNHVGPGQGERFVLPSMARQLARIEAGHEEPVLHVGNLEVHRDFLDVRDVVRAYVRLMERGTGGEVYNVCSGEPYSLADVVRRLVQLSATGARLEVDPERVRPVDVPYLVGDPARLRSTGWAPTMDLERSLRDLLDEARVSA